MNKKDEITITEDESNSKDNKLQKEYTEKLYNLNIYNLIKSEPLLDKNEALKLLIEYFNLFHLV